MKKILRPGFVKGNSKLGNIWVWNVPAIITCPGASEVCLELLPDGRATPKPRCYGCREGFRQTMVKQKHETNYQRSLAQDFVEWAISQIAENAIDILRWHSNGDVYDAAYLKKIIAIVRATPHVKHYAYTRSWWYRKTCRVSKVMVRLFTELGQLPNFRLWFSFDRSMSVPPRVEGIRLCYLSINDEDEPPCQALIFRDWPRYLPKTIRIRGAHGSIVCPYENAQAVDVTCRTCGICHK